MWKNLRISCRSLAWILVFLISSGVAAAESGDAGEGAQMSDERPPTAEEIRFIELSLQAETDDSIEANAEARPPLGEGFDFEEGVVPFDPNAMATCIERSMYDAEVVGYSYAIVQSGKLKNARGKGWARAPWEDLEPSVAMSLDQRMTVASISKTVTAVGTMYLVDQGQLSLGEPFYPLIEDEFPNAGAGVDTITIRQLLTHTSGLSASNCGAMASSIAAPAAGNSFDYENVNYCTLRKVIEHVSGEDYVKFIQDKILAPMDISTMSCAKTSTTPTLYYNTSGDQGGKQWPDYTTTCGAYGWYASAIDLAKFLAHFRYNTVLSQGIQSQMLSDCPSSGYCLGWRVTSGDRGQYFHHGGDWINGNGRGFTGVIMRFPSAVDAVLLVDTRGAFNKTTVLREAFDRSFKNGCVPPPSPSSPLQCADTGCGTQVNFACAQVGEDASGSLTPAGSKPFNAHNNPDGAAAFDKYCVDFPEVFDYYEDAPPVEMVCAETKLQQGTFDVCKSCADGATWPGCACNPSHTDPCGPGLTCYPSTGYATDRSFSTGRCWDSSDGPPSWECQADCHQIYGDSGFCHRGALPWEGAGTPICASTFCDVNGIECAENGLFCNVDSNQCEVECNGPIHQPDQGQYSCQGRGYSPEFSCNLDSQRCFIAGVPHP